MTGKNSICVLLYVKNHENPKKPFRIVVQANRNWGICDLMFVDNVPEPEKPLHSSNKEAVRAYNIAKEEYDSYKRGRSAIRSKFLDHYQGRQLNREGIEESIVYFLTDLLN